MSQNEDGQQQYVEDDAYCTEYVQLPRGDDGQFRFAFICPKCGYENKLNGDPHEFRNRTFHCYGCWWVPLLQADVIDRFIAGLDDVE